MRGRGPGNRWQPLRPERHSWPVTLTLRREEPADHRGVEELTRDAFWGMEGPGCVEHLLVHRLRATDAFVPELSVVAEADGVLVGHIVWTRAQVVGPDRTHDVLTFGPLSVAPEHQGTGIGGALMRHTLAEAAGLGHRVVVVYGHAGYYPRFGFVRGADVGITAPGGATFDALMARALVDGGLDGVRGEFREDPAFQVDEAEVEAFDSAFPPRPPAVLTPIDALTGSVPAEVVQALRAGGLETVQSLRMRSGDEVAALDGVGQQGRAAVGAWMRAQRIPWGP